MFATNTWNGWRGSWFLTLDQAIEYACDMLGVVAVEEIGVGVVWMPLHAKSLLDTRFSV